MKVSILIPMYNSEKYIAETIGSVLQQTYSDYELLLIDDASTDTTYKIAEKCAQENDCIVLVKNTNEKGPSGARNTGLELTKGEYIALLDADDLMLPDRLKRQVEFLDNNTQTGVVGTWIVEFGNSTRTWEEPTKSDDMKAKLIICPSIANPSAMIRKEVLTKNDIKYRSEYDFAEDYDMWVRLMSVTEFANLPEILTKYRIHEDNISIASKNRMINSWKKTEERIFRKLEIPTNEELFSILDALESDDFSNKDKNWRNNAITLCKLIISQNDKHNVFPKKALEALLKNKISLLSSF